ncbi:Bifunctional ribulose 5-phosphate reductase/CDP-ribitol pyrophosphorylase Bcs1 [Frankliniella fusca]|uniref:Bifunctional ribulose 5-phosphate reductase/CDP-ribitol pyrophosphorylase Bcs1 n=1 Tax=Frankliniella fusca TaxID=407009 RepID=A0AAE1GVI8_9NEOP|nr:Bifunctional ribulose 5-phosphate reductase/CDP-ribitol pyrophosphorylase Bcs1 [Frankliniella fusca]
MAERHFHARSVTVVYTAALSAALSATRAVVPQWLPTSTGAPQRNAPQRSAPQRDAHFGNAVRGASTQL